MTEQTVKAGSPKSGRPTAPLTARAWVFRAGIAMFAIQGVLACAHLLWPDYEWGQGRDSYFNLGNSLTLASWLASMQLALTALLALVGLHRDRQRHPGISQTSWIWVPGAALLALLSLQEMTRFLDRLQLFGYPDPGVYERMVGTPLALGLLALFGWFLIERLHSSPAGPYAVAWVAVWGCGLLLAPIVDQLPERHELLAGLATGMALMFGCTLLLLAVATHVVRPPAGTAATEPAAPAPFPAGRGRSLILLGVGGTTFSIIFLQIVLFQMLTIFGNYITANTVIAIALLGISVGGLIGFFTSAHSPMKAMIGAALLMPLAILIAFGTTATLLNRPLVASILMMLPFVCASTVITVALARSASHVVYFVDLLGAALGALVVGWAMKSFREESSMLLLAAFSLAVAVCFIVAHPVRRVQLRLIPLTLAGLLLFGYVGVANLTHDWLNVVRTEMQERYPDLEMLYSRSSFVGRYDVIRTSPDVNTLKTVENGRIIDTIRSWTEDSYQIDPRVPHTLYDDAQILIIGLSGDAITKTAKAIGAKVYGIEINPAIIDLQRNELAEYNGNSYEGIEVHAMDGRTFVDQSEPNRFDMITLMNAHFAKGYTTGRSASAEYLQTVEAMRSYLRVLTDRGVVNIEEPISRPERETQVYKLLQTMKQALIEEGRANPEQHFFVFQWKSRRNNYYQILMKKTPFSDVDLANLRRWLHECDVLPETERAAGRQLGPISSIQTVLYAPDEPYETNLARILEGRADEGFLRAYNVRPTTDNQPYPFDVDPARAETKGAYSRTLWMMLLLVPFFGLFLVRHRAEMQRALPYVSVVALTGLGYLMIEVVLIQRYAVYIGSPVVSFSTVLGSLLIFSGLGSLWSGRVEARGLFWGLGALLLLVALHMTLIPALLPALGARSMAVKVLMSILSLAPLAFFMGVPFPFVMRLGKERFAESSAAMLFAINAATSALAVPLALNISTAWGMRQVLMVSLLLYVAVALSLVGAHRPRWLQAANALACALMALLLVSPWLLSRPASDPESRPDRYEIYALSMGASSHRDDRVVLGGSPQTRVPFEWMFWLVRGADRTILVDAGFDDLELAARWNIEDFVPPAARLAQLGLRPEDITDVILTHLHWDHAGGLDAYTRANIWIQETEIEHARSRLEGQESAGGMRREDLDALDRAAAAGRLKLVRGDQEPAPGIALKYGGAHTPGFQYVTVETRDGRVLIAGDATYLYWNNWRHAPIGTSVDPAANLAAIRRMHHEAASPFLIMPGHDPSVMRWFPDVAAGIVRISIEAQ